MRDRGDERNQGKVIQLALVRRRKSSARAAEARERRRAIATSLHVDITTDGEVTFPPLVVHSAQAVALLKIVLAVSTYLVEVHATRM